MHLFLVWIFLYLVPSSSGSTISHSIRTGYHKMELNIYYRRQIARSLSWFRQYSIDQQAWYQQYICQKNINHRNISRYSPIHRHSIVLIGTHSRMISRSIYLEWLYPKKKISSVWISSRPMSSIHSSIRVNLLLSAERWAGLIWSSDQYHFSGICIGISVAAQSIRVFSSRVSSEHLQNIERSTRYSVDKNQEKYPMQICYEPSLILDSSHIEHIIWSTP